MKFMLTRQSYWGVPAGENLCVEIAAGGWDYCNADALVKKYPGEMEEYNDPRKVADAAIKIAALWQADLDKAGNGEKCYIDYGSTMGFTCPFTDPKNAEEVKKWAEELYETLPKCDECGELLGDDVYRHEFYEGKFCSERCCEKYVAKEIELNEELEPV